VYMRTVGAAAMIFASLLAPSGSKALPVQGVVGTLIPTSTMDHVYTFNIVNGAGTVVFDATRYTVECFRISAGIFNFAVGNARNGSRNLYFHVRTVDMRHLRRDVDILLDIYNDTWKDNWGYVPATPREAHKMASDLRLIADKNIGIIAEIDGEPAGMILGLPNLYEAIRDFRGFINPWNAARLLWRLKIRKLETGRLLLFGVKPKYRRSRELVGLPFLLLYELYLASQKGRYQWGEMSWVLENNGELNAIMPKWDAYVYKRYRIYEKALA